VTDPEALVLHVVAQQSQAQYDAELGETAEDAEGTEPAGDSAESAAE
jgi:hypothetical protein